MRDVYPHEPHLPEDIGDRSVDADVGEVREIPSPPRGAALSVLVWVDREGDSDE